MMFTVISIMALGMMLGFLLRRQGKLVIIWHLSVNISIYLLLFLLGFSVGGNEAVMSNLGGLGLKALLLALAGVAGSSGLSYFTYKYFLREK